MTKIAISPNASGTGTFTLTAPNSNDDRTFTLPDATGEVLTDQSDIEAQVKTATNASGAAPVYACRAWVNFNGTDGSIRGSGNVSSITVNGTGNYTVNFTTAMPDANFSAVAVRGDFGGDTGGGASTNTFNTSSVRVLTYNDDGQTTNRDAVCVAVFR